MNKTKETYYKLLKESITNWRDYDAAREDESYTARLEELRAYRIAWKSMDKN